MHPGVCRLSMKSQIVKILDSVGQMVSVTTTQSCHVTPKQPQTIQGGAKLGSQL